jgi:NAD(P)-dependent dehydrogenase (short-subunit alcohol dehydrogenase family)
MEMIGSVLITGANRGIGLGLVRSYAADGWRVHACCRRPDDAPELAAAAADLPRRLLLHALDVTVATQAEELVDQLGGTALDILINNAAADTQLGQSLETIDAQEWQRVFATNVIGPALLTRSLLPCLRRSAAPVVVNLGSRQGSIALNSSGHRYPYRTSKAALNMLTKCLAIDLREWGVTCVSLHPGWVQTRLGGPGAILSVAESAADIRSVVAGLGLRDSGRFLDHRGEDIPW